MSVRTVRCPGCQAKINVKNEITRFKCPKCQMIIVDEPSMGSFNPFEPLPSSPSSSTPAFESPPPMRGNSLDRFPTLHAAGPKVSPYECVEPQTPLIVAGGFALIVIGILFVALVTFGVGLIAVIFAPIIDWFNRKKAMAMIHGSGIKVGPDQFPEIYTCAMTLWSRISSLPPPEIYIIEAQVMNAFAVRLGKKNVVLLTDDIIHGCLLSKDPQSLVFVLAHELAHVALNHNSSLRAALKQYKKLSRLDEYSADRVAMRLVNDPKAAVEGMVLLSVGPQLIPYLNYSAVETQAQQVATDKQSKKAEKQLTHPLLLNRLNRAFKECGR